MDGTRGKLSFILTVSQTRAMKRIPYLLRLHNGFRNGRRTTDGTYGIRYQYSLESRAILLSPESCSSRFALTKLAPRASRIEFLNVSNLRRKQIQCSRGLSLQQQTPLLVALRSTVTLANEPASPCRPSNLYSRERKPCYFRVKKTPSRRIIRIINHHR